MLQRFAKEKSREGKALKFAAAEWYKSCLFSGYSKAVNACQQQIL